MKPDLVTVPEAAEMLRYSSQHSLRKALYRRTYPELNAAVVPIGRRVLFDRKLLVAFITPKDSAK